eukprot:870898-Amphidinium_carterae.1
MESLGTAEVSGFGDFPSLKDVTVWAKVNDEQVRSLCLLLELVYDTLGSDATFFFFVRIDFLKKMQFQV